MGVVDEVGGHAMQAASKSRTGGTDTMPTTIPDPPQVAGVKAVLETSNLRSIRNAGIVARKATEEASVGRTAPIQINLDSARLDRETDKARTTQTDQEDPEPERPVRGQPW